MKIKKAGVICTIGGGSGMPVVNRALVRAGFGNIHSVVTTFDSGGDSGRMRTDERGRILAFSDYWRSLMSLWKKSKRKNIWEEMLRFRDGRGRNFGNMFFQFLDEKSGGLNNVDEQFARLTGAKICGQVIPISLSPADICFSTVSGKSYCGEHFLDELRMSTDRVENIWLEPAPEVNEDACRAVKNAGVIIFCPGSMYGSLLVNLLLPKFKSAILKSTAKKVLMVNLMSTANENGGFTSDDYVKLFEEFIGRKDLIDIVLVADLTKLNKQELKKVLRFYHMENSELIKAGKDSRTLIKNIAMIEQKNMRLRHSESKLAKVLKKII